MIRVFLSHATRDVFLADRMVRLVLSALPVDKTEIRCTSLPGYYLPFSANISRQIRDDLQECKAIIALITRSGLESDYVAFEMGAAWAMGKLVPILGPTVRTEDLPNPIKDKQVLGWHDERGWRELIAHIASLLRVESQSDESWRNTLQETIALQPVMPDAGPLQPTFQPDEATVLTFRNLRREPIRLFWRRFDGTLGERAVIGPGQEGTERTFVNHSFVLKDLNGEMIGTYYAVEPPGIAVLR